MDVIEKYFHRLRMFLPRDQRNDIVHELSGEVRAQAADEESRLGRRLWGFRQHMQAWHLSHLRDMLCYIIT